MRSRAATRSRLLDPRTPRRPELPPSQTPREIHKFSPSPPTSLPRVNFRNSRGTDISFEGVSCNYRTAIGAASARESSERPRGARAWEAVSEPAVLPGPTRGPRVWWVRGTETRGCQARAVGPGIVGWLRGGGPGWFVAVRPGRMRKLRAALVDLSGTLHVGDAAVPGAQESLLRLRKLPLSIRFVTNTTKECRRDLHARLTRLGFALEVDEIFTSLSAARSLLEVRGLRPLLMLEDSALEDFQDVNTAEPNAVLVGLAPERFHYEAMNEAFRLVLEGAQLVAVHKARYYRRADGLALGPGPFVAALEYAAGVQALAVGKPEGPFFLEALRGLDCEPHQAVMIGDDARDDVAGAQRAGMRGILVKTGKYCDGDESRVDPGPNLTCSSFPDAVQALEAEFLL